MAQMFKRFERIFTTVCVLVTFSLVCWCIYEYELDLDFSLISEKEFGEDDNMIMPTMSFCFDNPFIAEKFDNQNLGLNVSYNKYKDFLLGKAWDHRMLNIDFENVTKRMDDYVVSYGMQSSNGSKFRYKSTSQFPDDIKKPRLTFVGKTLYPQIIKCYGINLPMSALMISFVMKKDIFPGGIRGRRGLLVSFHYPNQFFRSWENAKNNWPIHMQSKNRSLRMQLTLNTFDVTQRRNSRKKKCIQNWKEYDFDVARHYLEKMRCRPVYDIWDSSYPTCNSSEKMAMAPAFGIVPKMMEPCQSANKVVFDHMDKYVSWLGKDEISLSTYIRVYRVKVIEQRRAYDFKTLVGNSGGYIGLFLGTYKIH